MPKFGIFKIKLWSFLFCNDNWQNIENNCSSVVSLYTFLGFSIFGSFHYKTSKMFIKELKRDREYELATAIVNVGKVSSEMESECMFDQKCQIHREKILV
jgi:hypothetical protein